MSALPSGARPGLHGIFLIGIMLIIVGAVLVLPLATVFVHAFDQGVTAYVAALADDETSSALLLTLAAAICAVACNVIFGVAVAWLVTKFEFRGKQFLMALIEVPLAVSPVIAGLMLVLLCGSKGWFGPMLQSIGLQVIFAPLGIYAATVFITVPFVARELIPLMQSQGSSEEEAALTMGASGFQTFLRVTLPNIKWGLLYGVILCNARAMGEFGAVSVVSGHIRGETNTLPLHVEILYNEYKFTDAFAVASLLSFLALITVAAKSVLEWRVLRRRSV